MRPGDDEARIRDALTDAHAADRPPSFERMWTTARRPRARPLRRWVALSAGLAAAVAVVWFLARPHPPPSSWQPTGTRWTGPTDFLLETPDLITLRTLPSLDPSLGSWPAPPLDRRGVP
jgi:hypothetical protein